MVTNRSAAGGHAQHHVFERVARAASKAMGSAAAFTIAIGVVVLWAVSGPLFGFSQTWQLVINTGTTIVTFLMVFLIQRAQNKDSLAIHLKLNEVVAALEGASNRLIDVESLTEKELATLHRHFHELAVLARKESDLTVSHSVEEAGARHTAKLGTARKASKGK